MKKLKTFHIILAKKKSLFQINLGPVKALDEKDALHIGRKLCDEMGKPAWKKLITAHPK